MAKIKELPSYERPREKALHYGISTLSDSELLSILLGNGYKENNILEISTSLLSKYGGIVGLLNVPVSELKKNKGIKDVGALKISLIAEFYKRVNEKANESVPTNIDDEYLYNKYKSYFLNATQEKLILIILNKRRQIIFETELYKGSRYSLRFDFNDIYKEIVKHDGKYFYLIHNHPDGNCVPSEDDINATENIIFESKRHRVVLINHLIIGDNCYYSFKKMKKITISC